MSQFAIFASIMLLVSAMIWGVSITLARLEPRLRHWSAFWAAAIGISLLLPLLALVLMFLPSPFSTDYFELPLLHVSMNTISDLVATNDDRLQGDMASGWSGFIDFAAVFYLAGVGVFIARLIIGRWRVSRIAARSTRKLWLKLPEFWVTNDAIGAFAYVPLGRKGGAKIIIPQSLVQTLCESELADIISHEKAHIQRHDDAWGVSLRLILALCWASPFMHLFFSRWTMSAEMQSDMAVNLGRPQIQRRDYAQTLLKALQQITASRVWQYPVASFSTRHHRSEKMRIKHILTGELPTFKSNRHRAALSLLAFGITVIGALIFSASTPIRAVADSNTKTTDVARMVSGRLTAPYGNSYDPFKTGKAIKHNGIDVAAPVGTPIYAPADGLIVAATDLYDGKSAYGKVVVIKTKNETQTLLAHLDSYQVIQGQHILKGTRIASVGNTGKSTGSHVHIETFKAGKRVDPLTVWQAKE